MDSNTQPTPPTQSGATPPNPTTPPPAPTPSIDQVTPPPTQETPSEEANTGFTSSAQTTQPVAPVNPAVVQAGEDPGKTLGILGIVLGVLILPPIGIVLGIMSKNRSKAAGHDGTLGQVSFIIGTILTVLIVLMVALVVVMMMVAAGTPSTDTSVY